MFKAVLSYPFREITIFIFSHLRLITSHHRWWGALTSLTWVMWRQLISEWLSAEQHRSSSSTVTGRYCWGWAASVFSHMDTLLVFVYFTLFPLTSSFLLFKIMWRFWSELNKTACVNSILVFHAEDPLRTLWQMWGRATWTVYLIICYLPWLRSGGAESCCGIRAPSAQRTSSHRQQAVRGPHVWTESDSGSAWTHIDHVPSRSGARQRGWSHFRCGKVSPGCYFLPSPRTNVRNRLFYTRTFVQNKHFPTQVLTPDVLRSFSRFSSAANKWLQLRVKRRCGGQRSSCHAAGGEENGRDKQTSAGVPRRQKWWPG